MAVTFTPTIRKVFVSGDRKEVIADIACTGVPTVGGDALTAVQLGFDPGALNGVEPLGGAVNAGGTSGANVAVIHPASGDLLQVLIAFLVQGTAGAANLMIATTANTANLVFRVRAVGKSGPAAAP